MAIARSLWFVGDLSLALFVDGVDALDVTISVFLTH